MINNYNNSYDNNNNYYFDDRFDFTDKKKLRSAVAVALVLILGMMSALAAYYVDQALFIVVIGLTTAIISLIYVIDRKDAYPEQKLLPRIFLAVGTAAAAAPPINRYILSEMLNVDQHITVLSFFMGLCFMFLGVVLFLVPLYTAREKKKRCTEEVMATCVALVSRPGSKNRSYAPVWEFKRGSVTVKAIEKLYSFRPPQVGDVHRIMVNLEDPKDIFRPDSMRIVGNAVVGVISLLISFVFLFAAVTTALA